MYENVNDLGLSGSVVNGRVVLDPFGSDPLFDVAAPAPTSGGGDPFLAVNAPFDPQPIKAESEELVEA